LVELGRFDAHYHAAASAGRGAALSAGGPRRWQVGGQAGRFGRPVRDQRRTLRQDVALTSRSFDTVLGRKVLPRWPASRPAWACFTALQINGASVPIGTPLLGAGLGAVAGFAVADAGLRSQARTRRRDFRRALADYFDLVSLKMAGLAAAEQALVDAARLSDQWPMALVLQTLDRARLAGPGVSNWEALAALWAAHRRRRAARTGRAGETRRRRRRGCAPRCPPAPSMRRHELADAEARRPAGTVDAAGADAHRGRVLVFIGYRRSATMLLS
jgi:hypothetical protein